MTAVGELAAIHAFWAEAQASGRRCALATVVSVEGSSYRLPGARMLIAEGRTWVGTVSGGCLESDVVERSLQALRENQPVCVTYDTTDDSDIVFGLGMGCRGRIHVLIEPLAQHGGPLPFLAEQAGRRQCAVLATVFAVSAGRPELSVGQHFYFWEKPVPSDPQDDLQREAAVTFAEGRSRIAVAADAEAAAAAAAAVDRCGETLILWEYLQPPPALLICGAGHDALPLVQLAKALAWRVEVLDARPAYLTRERFPSVDALHPWPSAPEEPAWSPAAGIAAALLMTHNFERDRALLPWLIAARVPYIGLLGPKRRGEQLLASLASGSGDWLPHIFSPVGLDLGAQSPAEIALSIVSEVQMHLTGSCGDSLRKRSGPIHQERPRMVPALASHAPSPSFTQEMRLGVVVLAAGASRRMGQAKQALPWQGTTLLERAVGLATQVASPERVAVVLGAGAADLRPLLADSGVILCTNPDWSSGMQSSLRCGLEALLSAKLTGVLVLLGDQPLVTAKHVAAMTAAFNAAPDALIVAAAYSGTIGVPALFHASLFAELLAPASGDTPQGAKYLLKKYAARVVTVPLPEAGLDVDTPEDYQRLLASSGHLEPSARMS